MGPCRALPPLLLLLLVGLAGASTPGPQGSTPGRDGSTPSSPGLLSYGDVVAAAVELLNARAVSAHVLRLREAQPRPGWVSAELSLPRRNSRTGQWPDPTLPPRFGSDPHGIERSRAGAEPDPSRAGCGPSWGWLRPAVGLGSGGGGALMGPVPFPSPRTCRAGRS